MTSFTQRLTEARPTVSFFFRSVRTTSSWFILHACILSFSYSPILPPMTVSSVGLSSVTPPGVLRKVVAFVSSID